MPLAVTLIIKTVDIEALFTSLTQIPGEPLLNYVDVYEKVVASSVRHIRSVRRLLRQRKSESRFDRLTGEQIFLGLEAIRRGNEDETTKDK